MEEKKFYKKIKTYEFRERFAGRLPAHRINEKKDSPSLGFIRYDDRQPVFCSRVYYSPYWHTHSFILEYFFI
jgi:hypothetical protein